MSSIGAISYNVNNLTSQFDDTYKNAEELRNQYINSNNEERFMNTFENNKKINTNLQNISKATLEKLQADHQRLKQETQMIQKLKERSENSVGQLQATQATNDLIAYQIDELRKLRIAMMDQMNMLANVIAAQSNKEQAMEEELNEFYKDFDKAGRTQKIVRGVSK